jgi:hypothetical protein
VEEEGKPNSGNIIILPERKSDPVPCEDLIINKRKYRVPEKLIRLDFWNKLHRIKNTRRSSMEEGERYYKRQRPSNEPDDDERNRPVCVSRTFVVLYANGTR